AVGDEHEWRQVGPCGGMAIGLRQARSRVRVRRRLGRRVVPGHLGGVYLPADQDELRIDRDRGGQAVTVLAHRLGPIPGQPPEVEALEGALADTAEPGAESRACAGKIGLQPLDSISLTPAQLKWPTPRRGSLSGPGGLEL